MKNSNKATKAPPPVSPTSDSAFMEYFSSKRLKPENSYFEQSIPLKSSSTYAERNERYLNDGMSQFTVQFLRKMASSDKIPGHIQSSLFTRLVYVCKLLHMNELEIALWSLCVETANMPWDKGDFDQSMILLITGFQSKQYFNTKEDSQLYYAKVCSLHPDFGVRYKSWTEDERNLIKFSPELLNRQYNLFREMGHTARQGIGNEYVDYNQIVNELLRISTHNYNVPETPSSDMVKAEAITPSEAVAPILIPKPLAQPLMTTSAIKPPSVSSISEQKIKPGEEIKQQQSPSPTFLNIIVNMQPEDSETPRLLASIGRADSRILEMPLTTQRMDSAFTLLNPTDEFGMQRIWNSIGFSMSRPPTVHGDASKLLVQSQAEVEEKKEDESADNEKAKQASPSSSIADLVAKTYFTKSEIGTSTLKKDGGEFSGKP